MRRRLWSSVIGVLAVAAILVGLNLFADARLANVQLDLTQGHIYSLAAGTRSILRGLREPITLRLFYSRELGARVPSYGAYADRVREMLEQYARLARGKLKLEFYNPEPFSDVEDRALAFGLQGAPIDQSGEQVYFGLAGTNLLDDQKVIPFFQEDREPFLEYDLTKLVHELSNPSRPVVGVMSALPLDGDPRAMMMRGQSAGSAPWVVMSELRQSFDVRRVPLDIWQIDPQIQVLLVAQPQHLAEPAQYAIDQFVMRGGRLMLMVDPDSEAEAAMPGPGGMPQLDTSSDLHRLLDAWGIAYDPGEVVGDLDGAWRVQTNDNDRTGVVDYIAWFNIRAGINHDDPATAALSQITVAASGFLAKKPGAAITFTPLLSSSKNSGLIPVDRVRIGADPAAILAAFKPQGGARVIAARVRGVLHSAFTGPPAPPGGGQAPPNLLPFRAESVGPANLVVVADTDILADRFWVRKGDFFGQSEPTPFSDNGPFVANLIGTLAGGDALISLRGRGAATRPFTLVDDMQRQAEVRYRQTEKALRTHLQETQKHLAALRQGSGGAQAVITPEQRAAIDAADQEILQTRRQLRGVQRQLRQDIDHLDTELRLFDIVLVPTILALIAIGLGIARQRRRAQART